MSDHHEDSSLKSGQSKNNALSTRNPSVDWAERSAFPKQSLNALERISLAVEKPISRWVREGKFNPLYHTGTITTLLLFLILGTGIYLTMFYQFGFKASYQAVWDIEANIIGRVIRALHRYASGAAVIFALLHGWRTFFQDRFRGPRWLAWITGVGMATLVWLIGISGYWLVWDERAAVLNQTFIKLINRSQLGTNFLVNYLVTDLAGTGWVFMVFVISIHIGLSIFVAIFYWWHIKRLSRTKWLPPNYWIIAITVLLVAASIVIPVGMLEPIDPTSLPLSISIDTFYLFYLHGALNWPTTLFWGASLFLIGLVATIPWLLIRKKRLPIIVDHQRCTGCTLCAADCPYQAITMIERLDGARHKYLAEINPKLCVACGICVGTCTPLAMTLGGISAEDLWEKTLAHIPLISNDSVKVVFTCERHAFQGAKSFFQGDSSLQKDIGQLVQVIPLTCIGMAHPDLASKALEAGAKEVQFIGCPPEDCANREGNMWLQARLQRERLPKLKSKYQMAPISTAWAPPNDFLNAIKSKKLRDEVTGYYLSLTQINWGNFIPAIILLGVVFLFQIWLSNVNYLPYAINTALLEISLVHKAGYPIKESPTNFAPKPNLLYPAQLILKVDDKTLLDRSYKPQKISKSSIAFEQIPVSIGEHHIQLILFDRPQQVKGLVLYDKIVYMASHDVVRLNFTSQKLGGDPESGERIFNDRSIGTGGSCSLCHSLEDEIILVGPSLAGIASTAGDRVPNMSSTEYMRESILDPDAFIVQGFPAGQMLPDLAEKLNPEKIDDLVAFLLTLK